MSWRIVVISHRCKLDYKMGYMIVRGEETNRLYLDDLSTVIIEHPATSITGCLLEQIISRNINLILCDSKRNPMAEVIPTYGCHNSSLRLRKQIEWKEEWKKKVWTEIIRDKIIKQAELLNEKGRDKESAMLFDYARNTQLGDSTNREGHAAKVYFNALFGKEFTRSEISPINAALDYGYGILLSCFNRELVANGISTQLGIHHNNQYNHFNLSSDIMEPFRILIDRKVLELDLSEGFSKNSKYAVLAVLNDNVRIKGTEQSVLNAIKIYTNCVLGALENEDTSMISFYEI